MSGSSRRGKKTLFPKSVWDKQDLEESFEKHKISIKHIRILWRILSQHYIQDWDELERWVEKNRETEISLLHSWPYKRILSLLRQEFVTSTSTVMLDKFLSVDDNNDNKSIKSDLDKDQQQQNNDITSSNSNSSDNDKIDSIEGKLVIKLQDGQLIETVIIQGENLNRSTQQKRLTVCVSSQVGCKMGCTFCETGTMGFLSQLTAGEIAEQIWHVNRSGFRTTSNVVFMGMGEPLDNYDNVLNAIYVMSEPACFNIAPSRITISTVGVISRIRQLALDVPKVRLALSLHAPTQELRLKIVPSSKAFSVEKLIEACDYYAQQADTTKNQEIMIEYICIGGLNDTPEVAHQLGALLTGKNMWVNLIPYNPTDAGSRFGFISPKEEDLLQFTQIMNTYMNAFGKPIKTLIRWSTERGREVDAACGQLALKNLNDELSLQNKENKSCSSSSNGGTKDIEDLVGGDSDNKSVPKNLSSLKRKRTKPKPGQIDFHSSLKMINPNNSEEVHNDEEENDSNKDKEEGENSSAGFQLRIKSSRGELNLVDAIPTSLREIFFLTITFAFVYVIVKTTLKKYVFTENT